MKENKILTKNENARKALLEAADREKTKKALNIPTEYGGRGGLEPTRYDDWEVKGITSDF